MLFSPQHLGSRRRLQLSGLVDTRQHTVDCQADCSALHEKLES